MKKLLPMLALGLTILLPQAASAYSLTCGDVKNAVLYGSDDDLTIIGVHSLGVADMVATMLCFVGDSRCNCLSNIGARAEQYGRAYGTSLAACPDASPAVGQAFNAALQVCR